MFAAEEVERSVRRVWDAARQRLVRVRLATPSGFADLFGAELTALRAEHPEIALELVSDARAVDLQRGAPPIWRSEWGRGRIRS